MNTNPIPRYGANITTSDPAHMQGQVGFVLKADATERAAQIVFVPPAFRWPMVNEQWSVRMENGDWKLDGLLPPQSFWNIPPGDMMLNTPTGIVHVTGSGDGSTDFTFAAPKRVTLASGVAIVSDTRVTATSNIVVTAQDNNSVGVLRISARTSGVSFTITSSNGSDHGVVAYWLYV